MYKISDDKVFFGQFNPILSFIDINKFKILSQITLTKSNGVMDITNTGEKGVYALGCRKGLVIVKVINRLTKISDHLHGRNIRAISYIKHKKVILGIGAVNYFIVFDFGCD